MRTRQWKEQILVLQKTNKRISKNKPKPREPVQVVPRAYHMYMEWLRRRNRNFGGNCEEKRRPNVIKCFEENIFQGYIEDDNSQGEYTDVYETTYTYSIEYNERSRNPEPGDYGYVGHYI